MFQRLKECKTLKEIFSIIGTKPFEIAAFWIVLAWCAWPMVSIAQRIYWTLNAENGLQHQFAITSGYRYSMCVMGYISVYVAVFFLISRLCVYGKQVWKKIKAEPWHFLLLAMLLWSCISTLQAEDVKFAYEGDEYLFDGLRSYFFYAAVYVCSFIVIKHSSKWKLLNVFNIVANIISVIIILVDYTDIQFLEDCFPSKLSAVFFHFNHAGYYINMGILCAMGLYLYEKRRSLRIWYGFSMALQVYGILVNSTLGSFIGTCCALVMILIMFVRKHSKFAWRMVTPVIVVVVMVIASYFGYVPTSSGEDMKANFDLLFDNGEAIASGTDAAMEAGHGRVKLWTQSLKMIPARPIFGYGPEHLDDFYSQEMWVLRPDNELIQHAVFLGVPACLFYIFALLGLFLHQWKHMKQLDRTALIGAGCVIAYFVSSVFGVTAFYTTPFFYLFLGMAAGRPMMEEAQKAETELAKEEAPAEEVTISAE